MKRAGGRPIEPRKIAGYAFVAGMVAAPFLALIYGWNVGLAVMTAAMAATTYLAIDAERHVDAALKPRLRWLAGVNLVLAAACATVLVARIV